MKYDPLNSPPRRWERWLGFLTLAAIGFVLTGFYGDQYWESWFVLPLCVVAGLAVLLPYVRRYLLTACAGLMLLWAAGLWWTWPSRDLRLIGTWAETIEGVKRTGSYTLELRADGTGTYSTPRDTRGIAWDTRGDRLTWQSGTTPSFVVLWHRLDGLLSSFTHSQPTVITDVSADSFETHLLSVDGKLDPRTGAITVYSRIR